MLQDDLSLPLCVPESPTYTHFLYQHLIPLDAPEDSCPPEPRGNFCVHPPHSTSPLENSCPHSRALGDSCGPLRESCPLFLVPQFYPLLKENTIHPFPGFPVSAFSFLLFQGPEMNSCFFLPQAEALGPSWSRGWPRADWATICQPPPLSAVQHSSHIGAPTARDR